MDADIVLQARTLALAILFFIGLFYLPAVLRWDSLRNSEKEMARLERLLSPRLRGKAQKTSCVKDFSTCFIKTAFIIILYLLVLMAIGFSFVIG